MATYDWNGHTIQVELRPFGGLAWLVMGFVVTVDGRRFLPEVDRVGFNTQTRFLIEDQGTIRAGVVRSLGPMLFFPSMDYAVLVSDQEIARGSMLLKRWYLAYAAGGCLAVILMLALFGGLFGFLVLRRLLAGG
jgi:hypothetical protein